MNCKSHLQTGGQTKGISHYWNNFFARWTCYLRPNQKDNISNNAYNSIGQSLLSNVEFLNKNYLRNKENSNSKSNHFRIISDYSFELKADKTKINNEVRNKTEPHAKTVNYHKSIVLVKMSEYALFNVWRFA